MKIKWNKKYTTIAVYSLIVIMLAVLFVVFVFKFDSFKSGFSWIGSVSAPLICGIVIAYIVNPLMMWIERTFFHKLVENPPPEKGIVMQKLAESKVGSTAVVRTPVTRPSNTFPTSIAKTQYSLFSIEWAAIQLPVTSTKMRSLGAA